MRFGLRSGMLAAAALALVCSGPAHATDFKLPGKITIVKDTKLFKVVAKDPLKIPFTIPGIGSGGDPLQPAGEGHVQVIDTGGSGVLNDPLTGGAWQGLGNPPGTTGYKYKNLLAPASGNEVKIIILKEKVIKIIAKDDEALQPGSAGGNVGIILSVGTTPDRYCAEFGGSTVKNDPDLWKRKDAPAPSACSTVTPPTTTTSTLPAPCCNGDGFLNFSTITQAGDCGDVRNAAGALVTNINCSGLYTGGGVNSVPLPYALPDLGSSNTAITSCTGQTATVGATTSAQTGSRKNCTSIGCFFGAPLTVPNPMTTATSVCVINTLSSPPTGTVNCSTGATNIALPLSSILFLTGDTATDPGGTIGGTQPCPLCSGGTCVGGANNGMSCTNGTTTLGGNPGYPTSNDCPPSGGFNIGTLPVDFALSSGTVTWTGTQATNDTGSTAGSQPNDFAGYCRDADGSLCFKGDPDTACPVSSPGFQECWRNGMAMGAACSGTFESCMQRNNGAFGPAGGANKTIQAIGTAAGILGGPAQAKLVSVFSIAPTFNATVDAAGDLPGPGAVAIPGTAKSCAVATCP